MIFTVFCCFFKKSLQYFPDPMGATHIDFFQAKGMQFMKKNDPRAKSAVKLKIFANVFRV